MILPFIQAFDFPQIPPIRIPHLVSFSYSLSFRYPPLFTISINSPFYYQITFKLFLIYSPFNSSFFLGLLFLPCSTMYSSPTYPICTSYIPMYTAGLICCSHFSPIPRSALSQRLSVHATSITVAFSSVGVSWLSILGRYSVQYFIN